MGKITVAVDLDSDTFKRVKESNGFTEELLKTLSEAVNKGKIIGANPTNGEYIMNALGISEHECDFSVNGLVQIKLPDTNHFPRSYVYEFYCTEDFWNEEYMMNRDMTDTL